MEISFTMRPPWYYRKNRTTAKKTCKTLVVTNRCVPKLLCNVQTGPDIWICKTNWSSQFVGRSFVFTGGIGLSLQVIRNRICSEHTRNLLAQTWWKEILFSLELVDRNRSGCSSLRMTWQPKCIWPYHLLCSWHLLNWQLNFSRSSSLDCELSSFASGRYRHSVLELRLNYKLSCSWLKVIMTANEKIAKQNDLQKRFIAICAFLIVFFQNVRLNLQNGSSQSAFSRLSFNQNVRLNLQI